MKKTDFRRRINSRRIGYNPDRMKTAQIANGLYLQVTGSLYDAENVNRIAVPANKHGLIKPHRSETLLDEIREIETKDIDVFNLVRLHIREHLGADDAIFDRHDRAGCAYSTANARLVTDDHHNDGWCGGYLSHPSKEFSS